MIGKETLYNNNNKEKKYDIVIHTLSVQGQRKYKIDGDKALKCSFTAIGAEQYHH